MRCKTTMLRHKRAGMDRERVLEWLGRGMFEQVCREVLIRHENGLELLPVSVYFSRQDFDHTDVKVGETPNEREAMDRKWFE